MSKYEVYRELFMVMSWREGCIWRTHSMGCAWYDLDEVHGNVPKETNILYVAPSTAYTGPTIRRKQA